MSLLEILLLLLGCAGLTFTIVHAEIMSILKIRQFLQKFDFTKKLIKCALCTGTWVGMACSLAYIEKKYIIPFVFASAAFSFLFERTVILLDEKIIKMENARTIFHD